MMDTGTATITDIHLAIIVILAVAAVAAIVWGMRAKRARVAAAERFDAHEEESRDATDRAQAELNDEPVAAPTESPSPVASQSQTQTQTPMHAVPIAVAPSLPPIADMPAPGTPPETPSTVAPLADADDAPTEVSPAASPPMAPSPANPADRPVTVLKGLGPKVASALADRGITTVGQIAALDASRAEALDADLGAFKGRMARDRWIEQARFLAAGDVTGFEAVFGRL